MLERPADREFDRPARIETGRARVGERCHLRAPRRVVDAVPFALKEGELAHFMLF